MLLFFSSSLVIHETLRSRRALSLVLSLSPSLSITPYLSDSLHPSGSLSDLGLYTYHQKYPTISQIERTKRYIKDFYNIYTYIIFVKNNFNNCLFVSLWTQNNTVEPFILQGNKCLRESSRSRWNKYTGGKEGPDTKNKIELLGPTSLPSF